MYCPVAHGIGPGEDHRHMVRDLATKMLSLLFDLWLNEKAILWTLGTVPVGARKSERLMVFVGAMTRANGQGPRGKGQGARAKVLVLKDQGAMPEGDQCPH